LIPRAGFATASTRCAARIGNKSHGGVASFGRRPMFDVGTVLLEVFLFDFTRRSLWAADRQSSSSTTSDTSLKFDSIDELIRRMDEDSRIARRMLAHTPDTFPQLEPAPA